MGAKFISAFESVITRTRSGYSKFSDLGRSC